jgi:hypothetical protein
MLQRRKQAVKSTIFFIRTRKVLLFIRMLEAVESSNFFSDYFEVIYIFYKLKRECFRPFHTFLVLAVCCISLGFGAISI